MKKQLLTLGLAVLAAVQLNAQEKNEKPTISWGGYVKADMIWDTRNVKATRNGNYLSYPMPIQKEVYTDGKERDINSVVSLQGYAVEARLAASIKGGKFFGMQTAGHIEGDFFGTNAGDINSFHLRHAYVTLDSDKVQILAGQYWHPASVMEVFPRTFGFNAGHPYTAFNRSPQVRFTTKGTVKFIGALVMEQDMQGGKAQLRFTGLPAFHAQVQYKGDRLVLGAGVNVKTVNTDVAGINTGNDEGVFTQENGKYTNHGNLVSFGVLGYAKYDFGKVTWVGYVNYGQNQTELLLNGGYGFDAEGKPVAGKAIAGYTELYGKFSPSFEWGIFAGYDHDGGTNVATTGYNGSGVYNSYRISPRVAWVSGNARIGVELGYSSAQYGVFNPATGNYVIEGIDRADNFRTALSLTYNF